MLQSGNSYAVCLLEVSAGQIESWARIAPIAKKALFFGAKLLPQKVA
jgi:hypothetical protein